MLIDFLCKSLNVVLQSNEFSLEESSMSHVVLNMDLKGKIVNITRIQLLLQ